MNRDLRVRHAATTATLVCVAVVAGSVLAVAVPQWRGALGIGPSGGSSYAVGEQIDVPSRVYDSTPLTLLFFTRSSCSACQAARPAFADLVAEARRRPTVGVAMVIDDGTQADERQYLQALGLEDRHVVAIQLKSLRLQRVPMTVLVDRRGIILYSREGPPSRLDHQEILQIAGMPDAGR